MSVSGTAPLAATSGSCPCGQKCPIAGHGRASLASVNYTQGERVPYNEVCIRPSFAATDAAGRLQAFVRGFDHDQHYVGQGTFEVPAGAVVSGDHGVVHRRCNGQAGQPQFRVSFEHQQPWWHVRQGRPIRLPGAKQVLLAVEPLDLAIEQGLCRQLVLPVESFDFEPGVWRDLLASFVFRRVASRREPIERPIALDPFLRRPEPVILLDWQPAGCQELYRVVRRAALYTHPRHPDELPEHSAARREHRSEHHKA